jgi:acetyl-CoA C-acetyltransferase
MTAVYIVAANRTPIGSFLGSLSSLTAPELGAITLQALHSYLPDLSLIDHVYMGNVLSANVGQSPARQAAIKAGIPVSTDATTVNKVCASGLKAITLAVQHILSGEADCIYAGGMESMSNVPHYMDKSRLGIKLGHSTITDGIIKDGLWDVYNNIHMGSVAEHTAKTLGITREDQDAFAIQSYQRADNAWKDNAFQAELTPVNITSRTGIQTITEDEEYKKVDFSKLPGLKPVFEKDGTITAANASGINDGAAAVLVVSEKFLKQHNLTPLARIVAHADMAQDPMWFTTAPVKSAQATLLKAGITLDKIDFFEFNEAFAAVSLAIQKELGNDPGKTNIYGGAVALGHPIGASGARIVVTLVHVLKSKNARYGLAGICNGGGGSTALLIENIS